MIDHQSLTHLNDSALNPKTPNIINKYVPISPHISGSAGEARRLHSKPVSWESHQSLMLQHLINAETAARDSLELSLIHRCLFSVAVRDSV